MRSVTAFVLFTLAAHVCADEMSESSKQLENRFLSGRAQRSDLDSSLVGKASQLASLRPSLGMPQAKPVFANPSVRQPVQAQAATVERLRLHNLPTLGGRLHKDRIRVGRGYGGKRGGTAGKGTRGQKVRSGPGPWGRRTGFEGGQTTAIKTLGKPKGKNKWRAQLEYKRLNLGQLQMLIDGGKLDASKPITTDLLKEKGILNRKDNVKVLGRGADRLTSKIHLQVQSASGPAAATLMHQGSTLEFAPIFPRRAPPVGNQTAIKLEADRWMAASRGHLGRKNLGFKNN